MSILLIVGIATIISLLMLRSLPPPYDPNAALMDQLRLDILADDLRRASRTRSMAKRKRLERACDTYPTDLLRQSPEAEDAFRAVAGLPQREV